MRLNRFPVDPDRLKIVILSTPKTGNTWLRWLLHYAYAIPIVELPHDWGPGCADDFPSSFVTHQHLRPSKDFVRWLVESRAVVLTTIRHPADTFLSYFHYVKWHDDAGSDPSAAMLRQDGDRPEKNALKCITYSFPQNYAVSLAWAELGSHVVRYEDLLVDPLSQLREITSKIVPLDEERVKAAVFLCKPDQLTRPGLVDPRHLRTRSAGRWIQELPSEIADAMASMEPYASACKMYGYDWSRAALEPSRYDYDKIDPFRGHDRFDNGELIGPSLAKIYLHEVPNARACWPEPWVTEGESFWNWLRAPSALASLNPDLPPGTLTNIMVVLYNLRPDLQLVYRNPAGSDRIEFARWFLRQARSDFEIAWGLIGPVRQSFCDYLNSKSGEPLIRQPVVTPKGIDLHAIGIAETIRLRAMYAQDVIGALQRENAKIAARAERLAREVKAKRATIQHLRGRRQRYKSRWWSFFCRDSDKPRNACWNALREFFRRQTEEN
jgi:hypothetical protein